MKRDLRVLAAAGSLLLVLSMGPSAFAQKQGGILKLGHFDSPASMSMLEESTQAVNRPMSGVFNNLVMYKQDVLPALRRPLARQLGPYAGKEPAAEPRHTKGR